MIIQDARAKIIPKYIIIVIVCKVFGSISKFVCTSVFVGFNIIDFFAIKNDKPNNINNIDQTIPNTQLGGLNITFDPAFFFILHKNELVKQTINGDISINMSVKF